MPPRARRASARARQAAPSLDALPDDILGAVIALAGFESVGALLLVSKRWQRVLVEESDAFACFVLRPCPERLGGQAPTPAQQGAWLEGQRSFLQRVAPRVHELAVQKGAIIQRQANKAPAKQCQLPRQLSLLQPGRLEGLVLDYAGSCSEPLLAAAARAGGSSLARLEINSTRLPASAPRLLRALSALRSLELGCYDLKDDMLQAILTLTALTRLAVHPIGSFLPRVDSLLTTLGALRQLSISEFAQPPPYPEPQVRQLLLRASRLQALSYARTHMSRDLVGFQIGGALVDKFAYRLSGPPAGGSISVELGALHLPSLHRSLDALLPPARQLRALTLTGRNLPHHTTADCPALEDLTELSLENVECDLGVIFVVMDVLEQAPALSRLRLHTTASASRYNDRHHLNELPPHVEYLEGLTALSISGHPVTSFSPGPYLTGLKELEVAAGWRADALARLEGSGLSAATALTALTLSASKALVSRGFKFSRSEIRVRPALERADVAGTLAHLRQLRRLVLQGWRVDPAVMRLLRRTLPGLAIEHTPPIEDSDVEE